MKKLALGVALLLATGFAGLLALGYYVQLEEEAARKQEELRREQESRAAKETLVKLKIEYAKRTERPAKVLTPDEYAAAFEQDRLGFREVVVVVGLLDRWSFKASLEDEFSGRSAEGEVQVVEPSGSTKVSCSEYGKSYRSLTALDPAKSYFFAISGEAMGEANGHYGLRNCSFERL